MVSNNFPIWIDEIFPFALSPSINSGEPCRSLSNEVGGKVAGLPRQAAHVSTG